MPMSVVYTTVNGQILCENRGGVVSHFVSDPLGSVVMVRDNSGNTVYEAEYDPYGNVQSETGTNPSEFGYVGTLGYVKDSAFSLYVRARYLLTNLGRWLTKDPLWPSEPGFVYAGAAPNCSSDYLGLVNGCPPTIGISIATFQVRCAFEKASAAYEARKRCTKKYGIPDSSSDGTLCNAIQHCVWACLIAQECGAPWFSGKDFSKWVTDLHEKPAPKGWPIRIDGRTVPYADGLNNGRDKCMDLANNRVGIGCSESADCEACCYAHAKSGGLEIIKPIGVPSGWRLGRKCFEKFFVGPPKPKQ